MATVVAAGVPLAIMLTGLEGRGVVVKLGAVARGVIAGEDAEAVPQMTGQHQQQDH